MQRYEKYKDSNISWIGEIPEHWTLLKSKYVWKERIALSDNEQETLLSVSQYFGVGVSEDESRSSSLIGYKLVRENDLVINIMLAWLGGLGISNVKGVVSPAYCVYELCGKANPKYLHYLYRTNAYLDEFARRSKGVVPSRWRMYTDDFGQVLTLLPPLSEQRAIAEFLDRKTAQIDKAIELKQRQIALLKERRQGIIHAAVTGKMKNEEMKDSGVEWIGDIPQHWEVRRLKYLLKSQGRIGFKGYTTSDLVDKGDGALVLGATHLDWEGNIKLDEPVYISWKKYYESPEIMVSKGDVIIVQRGSTCGKVALIKEDLGFTTINPSLVLLKNIQGDSHYVFLGIKVVLDGILNLVNNTAIPMLSQFQIDNIVITFPPLQEQSEIVAYIEAQNEKIHRAISIKEQEIEKLREYKAVLIDSVVTGKVRVHDAP